jgi:hypothetical protein
MKLAKTLYVKIETGSGGGADFFVADTDIDSLVEMGKKTTVGVYRLSETKIVQGVVHVGKRTTVR